jgi:hypothetical protein
MVNTLLGSGSSGGTVSELWSDVPPLDGMQKADLEMPTAARMAIQAISQGRIDFIAYTTSQSPQEVQAFYTKERMQGAGWNAPDMTGCTGGTSGASAGGALCMFGKQAEGRNELLAIVIAREDGAQDTQVFFARIDATEQQSQ